MNELASKTGDWKARTRKSTRRLAYWTLAWTLSMAVAAFGPIFLWSDNNLITALAIFINLAMGIGMITANKRHLDGLDELQKKVALEAMALALGVGIVFGLGYSLIEVTHLLPLKAQISHLVILVSLTYLVGTILGNRRYK
ncbi:MAG: hypothetical protein OEM03_03425 [Chromatiales bacterium]|nr:hypothetical protein [Chromatiales bacterium]